MTAVEIARDDLFDHIVKLVKKYSKLDGDYTVTSDSKIQELGIDSIDIMEIAFELEEEHGVEVDESVAMSAETLSDIVEALQTRN